MVGWVPLEEVRPAESMKPLSLSLFSGIVASAIAMRSLACCADRHTMVFRTCELTLTYINEIALNTRFQHIL